MRLAILAVVILVAGSGEGWAEDVALGAELDWQERFACVARLSAANIGRGSIVLASEIAERCLAEFLARHHSAYHVEDVKRAQAQAPGGVLIDLMNKVPGITDIGTDGFLTLRASESLDCRSVHPGGNEMLCNKPIDQAWINEGWPSWQREFGGSRAEHDRSQLVLLFKSQERRRKLLDVAAHQR